MIIKTHKNIKTSLGCAWLAFIFFLQLIIQPVRPVWAQTAGVLPQPGTAIKPSVVFTPALITEVMIDPHNPLQFDFVIDQGDTDFSDEDLKAESDKLIRYFMAALTVPEEELWVNLSPYEENRIIPASFGRTVMGRDLLAQDYLLKQLTASLISPENSFGNRFWIRVSENMHDRQIGQDLPTEMFNKIWITPDSAKIIERPHGAVVVESRLKVLLEEDYLALQSNAGTETHGVGRLPSEDRRNLSDDMRRILRETVIPEIEKEINNGKNFAVLRQIYSSVILATWYKQALKESLLGRVYVDQNKTAGVNIKDLGENKKIYEQYVEAFQKGACEYIKEDYDPVSMSVVSRKYFSGGANLKTALTKLDSSSKNTGLQKENSRRRVVVRSRFNEIDRSTLFFDNPQGHALQNNFFVQLVRYEALLNDVPSVAVVSAKKLKDIYLAMYRQGLMTRRQIEAKAQHSNNYIRFEMAGALKDIDAQQKDAVQAQESGLDVQRSFEERAQELGQLKEELSLAVLDNRVRVIKRIGAVYAEMVKAGDSVDLKILQELMNEDEIIRRNTAEILGDINLQTAIKAGTSMEGLAAYHFWHDQDLFLSGVKPDPRMISYVFQLSAQELGEAKEWMNKIKLNNEFSDDHVKRVQAFLFSMEMLFPGMAQEMLPIISREGGEVLDKIAPAIVKSEVIDAFIQIKKQYPDISARDIFQYLQYFSALFYLKAENRIAQGIFFQKKAYFEHFHQLGEIIMEVFQQRLNEYMDDLKFSYFQETFDFMTDGVKPYILRSALQSSDRFTRRSAALKAGQERFRTYKLNSALIAAVNDVDQQVAENAIKSLSKVGNVNTIVRLNRIIDGAPETVVRYIYDDHGNMVAYADKVEIAGITMQKFSLVEERKEKNPLIPMLGQAVRDIEVRIESARRQRKIEIDSIKDRRVKDFFDFLKEHGLEKDIVIVGGGVRDSYTGSILNDIDINIRVPLTELDRKHLMQTQAQSNQYIYGYITGKLKLLAEALGVDVKRFLPPATGEPVFWGETEIQYTGPVLLNAEEGSVFLKRIIIGSDGWVYSSNTGATLFQVALDYEGNIYGHADALDDFDRGRLRMAGAPNNLGIIDILRMLVLKHQFNLMIHEEDYQSFVYTVNKYRQDQRPLPKELMRPYVLRQLKRLVEKSKNPRLAMQDLDDLGIASLVHDRLDITPEDFDFKKGGIDLNPNEIRMDIREEGGAGFQMPVLSAEDIFPYKDAAGFSPTILQISPQLSK